MATATIGHSRPITVNSPRTRPVQAPRPLPPPGPWRQAAPSPPAAAVAWSPRSATPAAEAAEAKSKSGTWVLLGLTAVVVVAGQLLGDRIAGMGNWAYLGVFFIELQDSAVPLLPTPAHAYTYAIAGHWNPLLVALLASLGSTIGETAGYLTGMNGQKALKESRFLRSVMALGSRWEGRLVIALAAAPIPVYLAGLWAGAFGMGFRKFMAYAFWGKLVLFGTLSALGALGA